MYRVKAFGLGLAEAQHLHAHDFQAFFLNHSQDGPDMVTLNRVGLDKTKSSLRHIFLPFWVLYDHCGKVAVGFIGLIVPHLARYLVGVDYRFIIPSSAVLGALLMVLADLGARMLNPPFETPIGALIAIVGVPFLLYLARKQRGGM